MGVVYLAFQPSLNRRVALKVVLSGPTAGSRDHARWLREARALSQVRHPNVVPLYEVGECEGWLYLVLEFVPGGTLKDRLDDPYLGKDAARLVEIVAGAVAAIHRAGLLHLDLKPSNILLDAHREPDSGLSMPHVGDFGIARRWDDPDASSPTASMAGPIGTPAYMAPEQVASARENLGPAADIYGLGALLYHILTGQPPFSSPSIAETLEQVRYQEPVSPRRLNLSIPRDLETICLRCLQKDPGRRYWSAEALADDLRRWRQGLPIAARPVSIPERTWRACRRRPAIALLTLALFGSLCLGFLGICLLWRDAVRARDRAEKEKLIATQERTQADTQRERAETERSRAEADFATANKVLDELVELCTGSKAGVPKAVRADQLIGMLRNLRTRLRELVTRRDNRPENPGRLAFVEAQLYSVLHQASRWDEARSLVEECITDHEAELRRNPADGETFYWLGQNLMFLGTIAERQGRVDECILHLRQALLATEEARARPIPRLDSYGATASIREALAFVLARRGNMDEARSLILANRRMINRLPTDDDNFLIAAWRVGVQADFIRMIEGLQHATNTDPSDGELSANSPLARLSSPGADRLSAKAWAALAADALRCSRYRRGTDLNETAENYLSYLLARTASALRSLDKLDQAGHVADRLLAFGRLLVDQHPDRPDSHLVLSEGYMQSYKNAWPRKDWAAIERNLQLAIDVNRRALAIDPNHDRARSLLAQRQHRLNVVLEKRRAVKDSKESNGLTFPTGS